MNTESPLNLSRFYILALLLLAILLTATHALMQQSISRLKEDAFIINISGAQRMLSQRLGLLTLEYSLAKNDADRQNIKKAVLEASDAMLASHMFLSGQVNKLEEQESKNYSQNIAQQRLSPRIHEMYFEEKHIYEGHKFFTLDQLVKHYIEDIHEAMALPLDEISIEDSEIHHLIEYYPRNLLPLLNAVVQQYEHESTKKNHSLTQMTFSIYIFMILAVAALGIFIFRPMEKSAIGYTRALEKTNENLELSRKRERMTALGELSGGLAHEINNTLQPVLGLSEVALKKLEKMKGPEIEKLKGYISVLHESALHARNIAENVLVFAKGEKCELSPYNACELFDTSLNLAKKFIPDNVTLKKNGFNKKNEETILVNQTRVTQILINLIKNAVDAINGSGEITIALSKRKPSLKEAKENNLTEKEYLVLSVQDNGRGIEPNSLSRIFTPFYTTKDVKHGTGLGLSTAYGTMNDFKGAISVESTLGKGTVFYLYFPLIQGTK